VEYEQGSSITLYATFVDDAGVAASISGAPTTTISHYWGNGITHDITAQDMNLLSGTTYYYNWNIPARADQTSYTAKYNAVYSGINLEIANIVGSDEFLVIKRKFYDKKGGGLVQKFSRSSIWSMKEKEEVIRILKSLLDKDDKPLFDSLENKLKGLSEKNDKGVKTLLEKSDKPFFDSIEKDIKMLSEKSDLPAINNLVDELKSRIDSFKFAFEKLSEKEVTYDDSNVVKKLKNLSENVYSLDQELRKERIGYIISELDDLHGSFEDFKKEFVKTLPTKLIEEIKNEDARPNSE